ncbi:MAG: inositol monophosphatase family protein [Actinomycetota bacterium]
MHDQEVAARAARAGAEVARHCFGRALDPDFKGVVDPVTAADREAEAAVLAVIRRHRPDDAILSEEAGEHPGAAAGRRWVVDPLDGTVNFLHGVPHCAVSVALEDEAGPAAAVIIDVLRGEEFDAARGTGARRDGLPLAVSPQGGLRRALLSTGFPYDRHQHAHTYTGALAAALQASQGVRRSGSACLDLAWVACGRYEGHWEFGLQPWDVAAGTLLVVEAGGRVTDSYGGPPRAGDIVASNGLIHDDLLALVAAHRPAHFAR